MNTPFDPIDKESLSKVLSSPPFITVDGVANIREVGGFPIIAVNHVLVKSGYYFRAADPSKITDKGKEQLRSFGIMKIFDFRSPQEIKAPILSIEGVKVIPVPISDDRPFDPKYLIDAFLEFELHETEAFLLMYTSILEKGGNAFGTVFAHMRDHPEEPCLIHCTAGKDRTGIFTALWLAILGASDEEIAKDYALTTYGLAPVLQAKDSHVLKHLPILNSRLQTILELLQIIRKKYGGVEKYLKDHARLVDEDIATIRRHYLIAKNAA